MSTLAIVCSIPEPEAYDMRNDIPRRARVDLYVPAETAIREAMLAVEAMPADVRLTKAVTLLAEARDAVADYVDGVERKP